MRWRARLSCPHGFRFLPSDHQRKATYWGNAGKVTLTNANPMTYTDEIPQTVRDEEVVRIWRGAADRETFLHSMRAQGATKIESIRALRRVANMPLGEAKEVVHFSPTWADRRAADDRFHQAVITALKEQQAVKAVA